MPRPHQRTLKSLNLRARGTISCPQTSLPLLDGTRGDLPGVQDPGCPAQALRYSLRPYSPHPPPTAPRFRQGPCPFPPNEPTPGGPGRPGPLLQTCLPHLPWTREMCSLVASHPQGGWALLRAHTHTHTHKACTCPCTCVWMHTCAHGHTRTGTRTCAHTHTATRKPLSRGRSTVVHVLRGAQLESRSLTRGFTSVPSSLQTKG